MNKAQHITAVILALFIAIPLATADQPATITVTGQGEVSVEPDRATINIGAVAEAKSASSAQADLAKIANSAIEAIKALKLDGAQLQTRSVTLQPVYTQKKNKVPKITGYRASTTLSVRFDDITRIAEVLDAAVLSGSNKIGGVTFSLQDDSQYKARALALAVEDAASKAAVIAKASGAPLGQLLMIVESGAQSPTLALPLPSMDLRQAAAFSSRSSQVETGKITIRASLSATYALGPQGTNK